MPPDVYPYTDEEIRKRLLERVRALGSQWNPKQGALLGALLELYAKMLSDTGHRLNCAPQKHRAAFLNLQQLPRLAARPAKTHLVFDVVKGLNAPIRLPKGTTAISSSAKKPLVYRTKWDFDAVSASLTDVVWIDGEKDVVERPFSSDEMESLIAFDLWKAPLQKQEHHTAYFLFPDIFIQEGDKHNTYLILNASIGGKVLETSIFAKSDRFCWYLVWQPLEEGKMRRRTKMEASLKRKEVLCLRCTEAPQEGCTAWLMLELLDISLLELCIDKLQAFSFGGEIRPQLVVFGDRAVDIDSFYPFGNPLKPLEECYIFCDRGLYRPGAEITVTFDLEVKKQEFLPEPPPPEQLKWVMKQPEVKLKPKIALAFAQDVRFEYWNGVAFCSLPFKSKPDFEFIESKTGISLVFDCPDDIVPGEAGGKEGYFIRVSSGLCEALYQIARCVYTPVIKNLRFAYRYCSPLFPTEAYGENYQVRKPLKPDKVMNPFCAPPYRRALCLGFDFMPPGANVNLLLHTSGTKGSPPRLSAELYGEHDRKRLPTDDGTAGLSQSGIISLLLPQQISESRLLGKKRVWICLPVEEEREPQTVYGVYLNAQLVENRARFNLFHSFDNLPRDGVINLPKGNIVQIWLYVRSASGREWEQWQQYTPAAGAFREGFYKADFMRGMIVLPNQIFARAVSLSGEDFVSVIYDVCDGQEGNVEAGQIDALQKKIPFIASVSNPIKAYGGMDSEPDVKYAQRLEHQLYHGGHAVTARDFEMIALDNFPQLHDARCVPGRPVCVAVLPVDLQAQTASLCSGLVTRYLQLGCTAAVGTRIEVFRAIDVPMRCRLVFSDTRHIFSSRLEQVSGSLKEFLNPVTGGADGKGWPIGKMPDFKQIQAFVMSCAGSMKLEKLEVTAEGDGLQADWEKLEPNPFYVPGAVRVEVEVKENA